MERLQFQHEEPRFDQAMQDRVIARAAQLQKEQASSLSRTELEQAAAEAGIDPQFVRAAIRDLHAKTSESAKAQLTPTGAFTILGLLSLNIYLTSRVMNIYNVQWVSWETLPVILASVVGGIVMSRTRRARTMGVLLNSMPILGMISLTALPGVWGHLPDRRFDHACLLLMIQVASILVGQAVGVVGRRLFGSSPEPARA